ncbi:MAG: ATP-dependent DNA ligase [Acidimicrobiia bacterium]
MSTWPFPPPIETMEARTSERWPAGSFAYEPKWDGFRAVAWGGSTVRLDSRNQRPLLRYFPELEAALRSLPGGTVVDGEVLVVFDDVSSFDLLQQRIHPAESRIRRLAAEIPAELVAFDLLAVEGVDLRGEPFRVRRERLVDLAARLEHPWHLTPSTTDADTARRWFDEYEAAGCDGIVAKPLEQGYVHGKRAMVKLKHRRTVECVVGGYRVHKGGDGIGSILLGLYDGRGELHFVGHCSGFSHHDRVEILRQLEQIRSEGSFGEGVRVPGEPSRWTGDKDLAWTPVAPGVVVEVSYDQLENGRFRHATRFHRWRPDREASSCTLDQLARPEGPGFGAVMDGPG